MQATALAILVDISVSAWPIKVNQPTAVTQETTLNSEQIDYFLKNYPGHYSGSYSQTPTSYLPDPEYARANRDVQVQQQTPQPFVGTHQHSVQPYVGTQQYTVQPYSGTQQYTVQPYSGTQQHTVKPYAGTQQQAPPQQYSSQYPRNINEQLPPLNQAPTQFYFVPTIRPYPKQTEGYDFYFPQAEDTNTGVKSYDAKDVYYRELQPPKQVDEPNYYALKPKKGTKKYDSQKKQVNIKTTTVSDQTTVAPTIEATEYQFDDYFALNGGDGGQATHQNYVTRKPERLTPKSAIQTLRQGELNTGEYLPSILRKGNEDNERVEFQMHGFNGPNSYKFGFDTGKG